MSNIHLRTYTFAALLLVSTACGSSDSSSATNSEAGAVSTSPGGTSSTGGANSSTGGKVNGSGSAGNTALTTTPSSGTSSVLPKRMLFGNFAFSLDEVWMKTSGVKWDVRWTYLSGQHGADWYNSWGYGTSDGSWMDSWLSQCDKQGFIPGIHLYNIGYGHDTGDPGLLAQVRDKTFVANYFAEFKVLMQKAKTFGKPVIVILEGDSFGMIETQVSNDPNASATIASSGMAELAGLPNTVAGLGLAYLQIRKSVGAYNVVLGPDVPAYAANGDILYGDNSALPAHIDYQTKFFVPFGLGDNVTGDKFDLVASNPLSGDADFYRIVSGDANRWWDASDTASVDSKSFNRYAEWLRLFHQATGTRWILHQIPIGNSNNLNVNNDCNNGVCTPRTGYKDNRAEYFLNYDAPSSKAIRDAHLTKFANAGVFGLLFGGTEPGCANSENDTWTDGKLFLTSRVTQLIADTNGGFALP